MCNHYTGLPSVSNYGTSLEPVQLYATLVVVNVNMIPWALVEPGIMQIKPTWHSISLVAMAELAKINVATREVTAH